MTIDIQKLLQEYRETAPVDVENLILNSGLALEADAALDDGISGHIMRDKDGKYTIRASAREHEYRRRFTMAHELGHFVLHKSLLDKAGGVNDSTLYRADKNAPVYNSEINEIHERQANSFAANLLMPDNLVRETYNTTRHSGFTWFKDLYQKFQVSPSAMRWRLKNLGLEVIK